MRFLHLADVHLDTLFRGRSERVRGRLRDATREALRAGFARARDEKVDAVLIAGDLFDGVRLSYTTEFFLDDELALLDAAGIPVLHATGNHDPGSHLLGRDRGRRSEGFVRFDRAEAKTVEIMRDGRVVGAVSGIGHETDQEFRDISVNLYPPTNRGVPAVALLHTQVGGARAGDEHARYAPSELRKLRDAGFDYWALGHVHLRQQLSGAPGIHYPGNIQGRSPKETGAKGGLLVELPGVGAEPIVEFVDLAPVRWETLRIEGLDTLSTPDALIARVEALWRDARRRDPGRPGTEWIVRVELTGPSPLHDRFDDSESVILADRIARSIGAIEVDLRAGGLRPAIDPSGFAERQDAAGEAFRLLAKLTASDGASPSELLGIRPEDLAGWRAPAPDAGVSTEEAFDRYLRELLDGGEFELAERFLGGAGDATRGRRRR